MQETTLEFVSHVQDAVAILIGEVDTIPIDLNKCSLAQLKHHEYLPRTTALLVLN